MHQSLTEREVEEKESQKAPEDQKPETESRDHLKFKAKKN